MMFRATMWRAPDEDVQHRTGPPRPRRGRAGPAHRAHGPRRSVRPVLEALEGRHLLTAGSLDTTFGLNGVVTTDFNALNPSVPYCTQPCVPG